MNAGGGYNETTIRMRNGAVERRRKGKRANDHEDTNYRLITRSVDRSDG